MKNSGTGSVWSLSTLITTTIFCLLLLFDFSLESCQEIIDNNQKSRVNQMLSHCIFIPHFYSRVSQTVNSSEMSIITNRSRLWSPVLVPLFSFVWHMLVLIIYLCVCACEADLKMPAQYSCSHSSTWGCILIKHCICPGQFQRNSSFIFRNSPCSAHSNICLDFIGAD